MIAGKNTLKCRAELSQHSPTAPWGGNKMEDRHRGCVNWCQYQRSGRFTLRCRSQIRSSTHSYKTFPQKQRQNRVHKHTHTHTWFWMVQSGNTHEKSMCRKWQICSVPTSRRAAYLGGILQSVSAGSIAMGSVREMSIVTGSWSLCQGLFCDNDRLTVHYSACNTATYQRHQ